MALSVTLLSKSDYGVNFRIDTDTWHPLPIMPTITNLETGEDVYLTPKFFNTSAYQTWSYGNLKAGTKYRIISNGYQPSGVATLDFTTNESGDLRLDASNITTNSARLTVSSTFTRQKYVSVYVDNIAYGSGYVPVNGSESWDLTGLQPNTQHTIKVTTTVAGELREWYLVIATGSSENPSGTVVGGYGGGGSSSDYNLVTSVTWTKDSQGSEASNKHFMSWAGYNGGAVQNWQWAYYIGSLLRVGTNPDTGLSYFCDAYTTIKCTQVDNSDPDYIKFKITPSVVCHNYHGIPFHDFKIEVESDESTTIKNYVHYEWDRAGNWRNNVPADGSYNWYRDWPVGDGWAHGYTLDLSYKKPIDNEIEKHCTFTLSYPGAEVLTDFPEGYKTYYFSSMSNKINLTLEIPTRQCEAKTSFNVGGSATVTEINNPSNNGLSIRVDKNTQVKFVAATDNGYEFVGWFKYEDRDDETATPISTSLEYTKTITEDTILFAKFKLGQLEILVDKDECFTSVSKEPAHGEGLDDNLYNVGESITFSSQLKPKTDYEYYTFDGWYVNDTLISSEETFTTVVGDLITSSCTVVAGGTKTSLQRYSVVKTDSWVGTSTINGEQSVILEFGEEIILNAEPTSNYKFDSWEWKSSEGD